VHGSTVKRRAAELRALAAEKEAGYRNSRIGGRADVVVVGEGRRREGLTEDYLAVALADPGLPRRTRFAAVIDGQPLTATQLR
jgi:hypothetical protein